MLAWALSAPANAAWPQPEGETLIISTLSDYTADARYDELGRRTPASGYHKQELSFYTVYGLSESLTLGAQPTFFRLNSRPGFGLGKREMSGFSHIELFARQRLFSGNGWLVSSQVLVKLPGPKATEREPLLEASNKDAEGRLLFGRSGRLGKHLLDLEYFSSFEAGYRARNSHAADQLRGDMTIGIRFLPRYQLIAQGINIHSVKKPDSFDSTAYDLYKAQLSLLRDLPHGVAVQVGGYSEYAGRNIGAGNALFMAIWSRF